MLSGSLDGRGVWGRMDACIYVAVSLCHSPETITTLFVNPAISQHKMFLVLKKIKIKNKLTKWITSKDLLYSTGNSAQCYTAVWREG